jgi:hypothetical protein
MELRITGGEPLMSGHTWKLFDWFKENKGQSKTKLAINSNLGFDQSVLERMLSATEGNALTLYSSNEAVGIQAEYIRDGLDWDQWMSNMTFLLDSKRLKSLNVMCTINALCLDSLTEFLDQMVIWKKKYGTSNISFSLNIMRFPSFQGPLVLPDYLREYYRQKLIAWYANYKTGWTIHEFEKNHVERLIDYLDMVKTPHGEGFDRLKAEQDFKQFYMQYDERRGKDFNKAFSAPMLEWYGSI